MPGTKGQANSNNNRSHHYGIFLVPAIFFSILTWLGLSGQLPGNFMTTGLTFLPMTQLGWAQFSAIIAVITYLLFAMAAINNAG